MPESTALADYKETLAIVVRLLELERQFGNPPRQNEVHAVLGLRGGAIVLMVAGFENYLKSSLEEYLSLLADNRRTKFNRLPEQIRVTSVFSSLENALRGPKHEKAPPKVERLQDIERVCKNIIAGIVDPSAFSHTGGNPSSKTVRRMYESVGIPDVLSEVRGQFIRLWRKQEAHSFVADKLDEIVNHRHVVAHTASALNLSRSQLRESVKFLRTLATVLDFELDRHIRSLV